MATQTKIEALNEKRFAGLKQASEQRDVDLLMSWHSKDAVFTDGVKGYSIEGLEAIRQFYTQAYQAIPTFRIQPVKVTGYTPEFVASELKCEGEVAFDMPTMNLKNGDTMRLTGVSLFWWRWEGQGDEWDGSLEDEAVRGWKIIQERSYYFPAGDSGGSK